MAGKVAEDVSSVWALALCERPGRSSKLLTLAWLSSGCCNYLGVRNWYLEDLSPSLCLYLYASISLPFSITLVFNKKNKYLNKTGIYVVVLIIIDSMEWIIKETLMKAEPYGARESLFMIPTSRMEVPV